MEINKSKESNYIQCFYCKKFIDAKNMYNSETSEPFEDSEVYCCYDCNRKIVIPSRIHSLQESLNKRNNTYKK